MTQAISTTRLDLFTMSRAFLEASRAGDRATASAALGAAVPADWMTDTPVMDIFLTKLIANPAAMPWLARAMVLRNSGVMIGHCGFHGPPGAADLEPYAPGGVEIGYTVFAPFRSQGYATEAVSGLMGWAASQGVPTVVLSIAPDNAPSQAIARRLGFFKVGSHIDEEDGPEDVLIAHSR